MSDSPLCFPRNWDDNIAVACTIARYDNRDPNDCLGVAGRVERAWLACPTEEIHGVETPTVRQ